MVRAGFVVFDLGQSIELGRLECCSMTALRPPDELKLQCEDIK